MSAGYKIKNQRGLHFLTFTLVGWVDLFTREIYRQIVIDALKFAQRERGLVLYAYVIMSNHIHLICRADGEYSLSRIIQHFKSFTANKIIKAVKRPTESRRKWIQMVFKYHAKYNSRNSKYQVWIQDNHPVELYSPKFILQRLSYLHLNPLRAGIVKKPEHYVYSSASNYVGKPGIIEVEVIDLGVTEGYIHM